MTRTNWTNNEAMQCPCDNPRSAVVVGGLRALLPIGTAFRPFDSRNFTWTVTARRYWQQLLQGFRVL